MLLVSSLCTDADVSFFTHMKIHNCFSIYDSCFQLWRYCVCWSSENNFWKWHV